MRFAPYVLKTLWRHRSRSLLTVSGVSVALFVFCFVTSIRQGMRDLRESKASRQSLIVFQARKFCPASSHLPQDYEEILRKKEGVREVIPVRVLTNNCRASLDVVVFYGLPASRIRKVRDFELLAGNWADFERSQDAGLVGEAVAARRELSIGDKFSLGGITVTVAGIFTSDNPAEENYTYTHLEFLQRARGEDRVGMVTQFEVLLREGVDPTRTGEEIDRALRTGPVATNTQPKGAFQAKSLGDLQELIGMLKYLGYACVGLVLVLVTTTMVMGVEDRVKEHAVLQTIGLSPVRIFGLVLGESVILSVIGGVIGVGAALLVLGMNHLSLSAEAVSIAFRPSVGIAVTGMIVAVLAGVVAGLAPACKAARADVVSALRTG